MPDKAQVLRQLHQTPPILVLPNAWDAATARLFEAEGFPAIATTSAGVAAALGYPDGGVVPPHDMALHRLATALARAILRRRGAAWPRAHSGDRSKVTILIANAYAMGGTVRTVLNLAGFLAQHHDVEILSIQRLRTKPFFPLPPGVKVRVIDDQRKDHELGGWPGRVAPAACRSRGPQARTGRTRRPRQ